MPKQTFLNLPDTKRQQFIQCALVEFSEHYYDDGSINRIVEAAGIAKGSFYQYFKNKKDLYFYLIEWGITEKKRYLNEAIADKGRLRFFDALKTLFIAGFLFAKKHPELVAMGERFTADPKHPLFLEFMSHYHHENEDTLMGMLTRAAEAGEIKQDASLETCALILTATSSYLLKDLATISDTDLSQTLDHIFDILRQGIGA